MVESNDKRVANTILIFNEFWGFYRIDEGTGANLLEEDEEQGYVDYIMLNELEFDGCEGFTEIDGAQVMLTELYQEKFKTVQDVIDYLIWETGFLPNGKYVVLYAK